MSAGSIAAVDQGQAGSASLSLESGLRVLLTAGQLFLLAMVIKQFELESRGLYNILLLAVAGFVLQAILPRRWRMPCFALLSVASVFLVLHAGGLWVIALGGLLLGLSLLPVRYPVRLGLLVAVGLALALVRVGRLSLPVPIPEPMWPVLAGMFMFRLALFLHTVRHEGTPKDLWGTIGYFFMLPNAVFPFFPIVDYKTFLRQHYDAPASGLYARGLSWMLRGLVHLLLYRLVYHYVVLDPGGLKNLGDVVQYLLQTYLLYLRVSGQFHLIIGLLHLFGFRLPETHHLYYLADSFTEVWRRVNIYWKDFMTKVAYFPTFFRLRKLGNSRAIMISTTIVMFITWMLHGYQKFWIVGGNPFSAVDTVFWVVLSTAVIASAAWDLKRAKNRAAPRAGYDLARAVRTVGVFITICFLFALWTAESPRAFLDILAVARHVDTRGVLLLAGLLAFGLAVSGWGWGATEIAELKLKDRPLALDLRQGALHAGALGGLLLLAQPGTQAALGPSVGGVLATVASSDLNKVDREMLTRGYYESISTPNRLAGQLWEVENDRPADWVPLEETDAFLHTGDFLAEDLKPGVTARVKGQDFRVNSHGMHDDEYPLAKPPRTYRIAVMGPSSVMSPGIPDGTAFPEVLERRLNAELGATGTRYEVLNFGMAGYSVLQMVEKLQRQAMAFQPDLILFTSHPPDYFPIGRHLGVVVRRNTPVPYPSLAGRLRDGGVDSTADNAKIVRAITPALDSLLLDALARTDTTARTGHARVALLILRAPGEPDDTNRVLQRDAERRGWPVVDLSKVYAGQDERQFRIADWDRHFNVAGSELIAARLYDALLSHAGELGMPVIPPPAAPPTEPAGRRAPAAP